MSVRICHGHNTACRSEWKKNLLKVMLRPFSRTFATHYFACSDYAGKWLFGKNIAKSERFRVIPNAVEADKFRFNGEIRHEVRKELGVEAQISGVPCVFSGAMTKETAFNDGVTFVDLERSAEEWAQIILECAVKDRGIVQNAGNFEISDQARELGRFYEFAIEQTQ